MRIFYWNIILIFRYHHTADGPWIQDCLSDYIHLDCSSGDSFKSDFRSEPLNLFGGCHLRTDFLTLKFCVDLCLISGISLRDTTLHSISLFGSLPWKASSFRNLHFLVSPFGSLPYEWDVQGDHIDRGF